MSNPDRQGQSDYRRTEQEVANKGFDETFKVPATELLAYNSGTNTLDRVQINDSGQILTNAALTGSGGDGAILDGASSAIKATVVDYTNSNPLAVRLTDTNGDYIAAGAGTQYTEDAAAAANPVGSALNLVRDDARSGSLTSTDGDNVSARGTNAGELYVKHVDPIPATQSGTWNITNVSGTVSLPTGASTAAKQPALGTAGTASSDVLTVQGIASMTPLKTDGSGVTQPVSGTVTASQSTAANLNATVVGTGTFAVQAAQSGTWTVGANSATGSAVPANAFYAGGVNASGNLVGLATIDRPNDAATGTAILAAGNYIYNGTTFDRMRSVINAANSTGTGIAAVGSLAQFDDVSPTAITENQFGNLRMSANRNLYNTIRDAAGNERGVNVTAGNALVVDGSASTQPVSGTVSITANSAVNVAQMNGVATTMGNGVSGTGVQRVAIASDNTVLPAVGAGATGSTPPANASYDGLLAKTANPTAATDGNLVGALADKLGKQVVVGSIRDLKVNQITTITASTSETTIVTAVASTFLDVYGVIVANSSATATNVSFKDSTAGTTQFNIYVPAGETRGFMLPESGAIKQGTVNNNWTATSSASVSSLIITMLAVKNI